MRGETPTLVWDFTPGQNFNPLPSCEGRPGRHGRRAKGRILFQSTPLMRGETLLLDNEKRYLHISIPSPHARGDDYDAPLIAQMLDISIHSPHARGDYILLFFYGCPIYFNPLPSCEGRPTFGNAWKRIIKFQSTPLMRGETGTCSLVLNWQGDFNPLPSCEGRHSTFPAVPFMRKFQSTPLMRGETFRFGCYLNLEDFNPLPSCEGRQSP